MTKLDISKRAAKQLLALPKKQMKTVSQKLTQLTLTPYPEASKKLKGELSE